MANNPNANSKRTENKYEQTTPIPKNKTIVLTVGLTTEITEDKENCRGMKGGGDQYGQNKFQFFSLQYIVITKQKNSNRQTLAYRSYRKRKKSISEKYKKRKPGRSAILPNKPAETK